MAQPVNHPALTRPLTHLQVFHPSLIFSTHSQAVLPRWRFTENHPRDFLFIQIGHTQNYPVTAALVERVTVPMILSSTVPGL